MPAAKNTMAQGHFTVPSRACAAKTEGCVEGDGDSGRADGEMWRRHADKIDEERHGKDRTAATDQAEGQPDKGAGCDGERSGEQADGHCGTLDGVERGRRFHGMASSSLAMPHQPVIPAKSRPAPMKPDNA